MFIRDRYIVDMYYFKKVLGYMRKKKKKILEEGKE
jgi:hypothetical protein